MILPLLFGAVLFLIFFSIVFWKFIKKICRWSGKQPKYCSHGNKLIAMFIIVFYFIYLSVTRRALDIFNCNPVDPDDGYTYTEFTSIECEGGICRCDDPEELQTQLKPYAIVGIIVYSVGFPAWVAWITWFYRIQIKLDQLLRAHDLGDDRSKAIDVIKFTPRKCRSRSKRTYDIRKKYHKLYYHFKPGKVYWMLLILARKFCVAMFALLFRANVAFMLACVLMVLFACYVLQVRHRPYMSTVEREAVKEAHRLKAHEAELLLEENSMADIDRDMLLHHEMQKAIQQLQDNIARRRRQKGGKIVRTLSEAMRKGKKDTRNSDYYFDYNTVEQVLIACAIFISLVAIMFESGQFYKYDEETGDTILATDSSTQGFYTAILVMGATVLIGSLVYYLVVFMAEVIGHVPMWVRLLCASKKTRQQRKREMNDGSDDEDGDFEMADRGMYANPLQDLEEAKRQAATANQRALKLQEQNEAANRQKLQMVEQMKRLKQENQRHALSTPQHKHRATPRVRKEMEQLRVGGN